MVEKKEEKRTKVVILKLGNISSSILLEMLLDERADRADIDVRTISSGAKLEFESTKDAQKIASTISYDLLVISTPNASLPNNMKIIDLASKQNKPLIIITDILKEEAITALEEKNIGYLVVKSDAMIGARREFLDPIEMALYNADLLKVLAIGGVFNLIFHEINLVIKQIQNNVQIKLPRIKITTDKAVEYAGFTNPYAKAKAQGALEISEAVGTANNKGCFKIKAREEYIAQVAMAHEMMRIAASMACEAREIEKSNDQVRRKPHYYDGEIQEKLLLQEKPTSKYLNNNESENK